MRRPLSAQNSFIRRMTVPSGSASPLYHSEGCLLLVKTSLVADSSTVEPLVSTVPGFAEYKATYSHFRILKAKLYISRNVLNVEGSTNSYLVVGSRPFAAVTLPGSTTAYPYAYVPPQKEADLRQARWQKIYYPSTVRNVVTTSFHPYTMIETFGPLTTGSTGNLWPRIWEGRRWMPFSWVTEPRPNVAGNGITFYGPYMVIDTSTGELPKPGTNAQVGVECTLRISVQFKGQR